MARICNRIRACLAAGCEELRFPFACAGLVTVAPASADGPGPEFERLPDADHMFTSPDGQIRVEQYSKDMDDDDSVYQFWTFDEKHQIASLLNRDEDHRSAGYAAGFRFSREQPVAGADAEAGRRLSHAVSVPAERLSIFTGDAKAAWATWPGIISSATPTSKRMHRKPRGSRFARSRFAGHLVKGMEENYAWMGKHWPDSRYVVLSLSFDSQGEDKPLPWIEDWRCVYRSEDRDNFRFLPISPTTTPRRSRPPTGDRPIGRDEIRSFSAVRQRP